MYYSVNEPITYYDENQHGGGPGKGLGQWEEGGRFDTDPVNLVDFAKSKHTPWTDLETQLQFTDREFSTSEAGAAQKLQTVDTPKAAALLVSHFYERPNPASAHNNRREDYAQEDYDAYEAALAGVNR